MMRLREYLTVLLICLWLGSLPLASQDVSFKSSPLRGIKTVAVDVEKLSEEAVKIGLTEEKIRASVEPSLRREGIVVANDQTYPCLYIKLSVTGPACSIRVELREEAVLARITLPFRVTTWYAESTEAHGGDSGKVIAALGERLNGFIRDYWKANPKT